MYGQENPSASEKLERELCELQKRVKKYHKQMDRVKEVFMDAEESIKRIQSRTDLQSEIVMQEAAKEAMIIQKLAELEEVVKAKRQENHLTPPQDETMPDAARNASIYCMGYKIKRCVKIGCVMLLDSVAAYGLLAVTRPFFGF